jgi:phosphate-selective porin
VDSNAFPIYADANTQAERSTTFGTGLNWILNDNTKLTLKYDYTSFIGRAVDETNRPDANAITTQFQVYF